MHNRFKFIAGVSVLSAVALAQQTVGAEAPAEQQGLDEVVVTGTRFNDRTVTNSPVPIDLLRGEEIRSSGYQETSEIADRVWHGRQS